MLTTIADEIHEQFEEVYRMGGDEFNVLVDTINKLQNSNISLEDANKILENNFNIEEGFIYQDSVYNPKEF